MKCWFLNYFLTHSGAFFPNFFYLYLVHFITKHTSTTKEKLSSAKKKKTTHLFHGNCYLSKFSGHPPLMVLKLPTIHPHATWCTFPSNSCNTHSITEFRFVAPLPWRTKHKNTQLASQQNKQMKNKAKKLWTFDVHNLSWCPTIL